jgi:surfactin synthase thioesterase subunit
MTGATDWFVPMAADGGTRIFAFPHAGGGCAQLAPFARSAASRGLSVWSANLPGRQARLAESPRTAYGPLVDELTEALVELVDDRPYGVFGYCGGALLAFGVLRRLAAVGVVPLPRRFVVASYEAPDIGRRPYSLARLRSDELWDYLRESGGIPPAIDADERLQGMAEAALRADFTVLGEYRHEPGPPLPVPITVCFGGEDAELQRGALLGWRRQTTQPLELRSTTGGHWLLDDACDEVAELVAAAVSTTGQGAA